ncbi:hypothetical protein, partial [Phocaeicola plebeius]|uniref:hypothetical protein n=2 Tax=Phocaeicola plebeius TaxID=310297 RepID=UPI0026F26B76
LCQELIFKLTTIFSTLQTPKSLPPNAEAFQTKRQRVSFQTQRRFPPSYLPTLLFPESTYKNTPKPLPESSKHAQFMRQ